MSEDESKPAKPVLLDPETFPDDRRELRRGVISALAALPAYFEFDNVVGGIDATDLHNLNTLMGAAIENQVVEALNGLRQVWDPHGQWSDFSFVRSAQAFPDVKLMRRSVEGEQVLLGIELKGWFLLAKEGEPSLRYRVAPNACEPWDLVCVVPWYLNNAVAGKPQVATPWVQQARFAAEWRDYWWEFVREVRDPSAPRGVTVPPDAAPYPKKADLVSVVPLKDGGDNFGRLPRCRPLMDAFLADAFQHPILGIPARDWQAFLHIHSDNANPERVIERILRIKKRTKKESEAELVSQAEELLGMLRRIASYDFVWPSAVYGESV